MSESDRCLFCRIAGGDLPAKKVYEDDQVIAFEDINPQAPTHLLVVPRRHIASTNDLDGSDHEIMGRVIECAATIARERHLNTDGYRLVINCGEGAGQTVFHIHVHLLGGRSFGWPPG